MTRGRARTRRAGVRAREYTVRGASSLEPAEVVEEAVEEAVEAALDNWIQELIDEYNINPEAILEIGDDYITIDCTKTDYC